MNKPYNDLQSVITDSLFPEVDTRLRAGCHIDISDTQQYEFIEEAEELLQQFYKGYGAGLVHGQEGFYYLLPEGSHLLGNRRLSVPEMLVGQTLALIKMDPAYLKTSGRLRVEQILNMMEMTLGQETLASLLTQRKRGKDRETDNRKIRESVEKALRGLDSLGFITIFRDSGEILPRKAIYRFVDPVRKAGDLKSTLIELMKSGSVEIDDEG